jgi:hypothetical protein
MLRHLVTNTRSQCNKHMVMAFTCMFVRFMAYAQPVLPKQTVCKPVVAGQLRQQVMFGGPAIPSMLAACAAQKSLSSWFACSLGSVLLLALTAVHLRMCVFGVCLCICTQTVFVHTCCMPMSMQYNAHACVCVCALCLST